MKKICLLLITPFLITLAGNSHSIIGGRVAPAASKLPAPKHVLVVIMENHSFNQIFHSKKAPDFNALISTPHTALFTQSFAITHPSQPNYLALFSGDTQGCSDDDVPDNIPYTTPNLGRQLLDAGYTFATYSENLPHSGFNGKNADVRKYARKHNPVANWMGTGPNQLPENTNLPFTDFPSNYDLLPTVCFVIPNQDNDMHDGTIAQADKWYTEHLESYRKWAVAHNSLLIITFDEDDRASANRITTIFSGAPVKAGNYDLHITHYSVLRTLEDFYHLPHAGHAAGASDIDNCWE